jgi:dihydrofolate reductase
VGKLIYSVIASLDGYVADERGNFDWAEPDEDVHSFLNDLEREVATYLYGRRMYEVMGGWETLDLTEQPSHMREFAQIWREAEKIVYSSTLESPATERTRIKRHFDPEVVRAMKAQSNRDMSIGGPTLAAHAFKAGLIDECHIFIASAIMGAGKRSLPDGVRLNLELLDERRFDSGMVYLCYRT